MLVFSACDEKVVKLREYFLLDIQNTDEKKFMLNSSSYLLIAV